MSNEVQTEVWLVRHGETEWSRDGRHTGTTDLPLTATGEEQARRLLGHLDPAAFDQVWSSPRQRARTTAELAGFSGEDAPQIVPELAEWDYGDYEGETSDQIHEATPDWTIWTHGAPGGESVDQARARFEGVVRRLQTSGAARVLCFAHGHSLRALSLCWMDLGFAVGERFPLETGTVSVLGWAKGDPALERWNCRP
ncbi:MAG: histidine phosphatase family protein [Propionibacteriaceae bacterium]